MIGYMRSITPFEITFLQLSCELNCINILSSLTCDMQNKLVGNLGRVDRCKVLWKKKIFIIFGKKQRGICIKKKLLFNFQIP